MERNSKKEPKRNPRKIGQRKYKEEELERQEWNRRFREGIFEEEEEREDTYSENPEEDIN